MLKNNDIFPLNYKKMYPLITSGEIAFDLNQYNEHLLTSILVMKYNTL